MRIAITGASGHVGANLCRALLEKGYEINALFHEDDRAIKGLPINIVKGNVNSLSSLDELFSGAEIVIHAAAHISVNEHNDDLVIDTNVNGTRNIIAKCIEHKIKRLIHFSSIHAMDSFPLDEPLDETRSMVENSPNIYDNSKSISEKLVRDAPKNGLETIILCPTSVIGPFDFKPSMVGRSLINIYKGKFPALIEGGYDFVDVRDLVEATINAITMGRSGEKYLLSGKWHTIKELGDNMAKVAGIKSPWLVCPLWLAKLGLPIGNLFLNEEIKLVFNKQTIEILRSGHRNISSAKAQKELNFSCRPIEESIQDTYAWFKENNYL